MTSNASQGSVNPGVESSERAYRIDLALRKAIEMKAEKNSEGGGYKGENNDKKFEDPGCLTAENHLQVRPHHCHVSAVSTNF
jgi:hypothetical protein